MREGTPLMLSEVPAIGKASSSELERSAVQVRTPNQACAAKRGFSGINIQARDHLWKLEWMAREPATNTAEQRELDVSRPWLLQVKKGIHYGNECWRQEGRHGGYQYHTVY